MKNFIIGTAGHVDHGKTTLIKALTGRNTDRLKEEKDRGITIELGFTYIDLPHFNKTGIIDVPGHERFINNMLMGSGGIDLAMLVVAADESVMPQTKEHLDILNLLGIKNGIVVITKKDMVDDLTIEICKEEIAKLCEGTFLENAKIIAVSSTTGENIEELKKLLDEELLKLEEKNTKEPFRLYVDRSFTLKGIGTVVTGTVLNGEIDLNKQLVLYPKNIPLNIRSLQVHSENVEKAYAGERLAINIVNLKKDDIKKGDVIAQKDSLTITKMLDVKISMLKDAEYKIKNNSLVHIFLGSNEAVAKVVLMNREIINEAEFAYAQLRFTEDVAAKKGDTFIIRFFSPEVTIAGGVVLDKDPIKKKNLTVGNKESVEIKEIGSEKEQIYQVLKEAKNNIYDIDTIIDKGSFKKDNIKNLLNELVTEKRIVVLADNYYIADVNENRLRLYVRNILSEFHKENNLKQGMQIQELRSKLINDKNISKCDLLLNYWMEKRVIKDNNSLISNYEFKIENKDGDFELMNNIENRYKTAEFDIPVLSVIEEEFKMQKRLKACMSSLFTSGKLIRLDDKLVIHKDFYDKALESLTEQGKNGSILLGEYRDRINASRKVALALLDYFDKKGITIKNGDERKLKERRA